jgi:hypothetical protein
MVVASNATTILHSWDMPSVTHFHRACSISVVVTHRSNDLMKHLATALALAVLFVASALQATQLPELPRTYLDTRFTLPAGERHTANNTAEFQSALNAAKLGDIIELKAGVTYVGPFTLPKKTEGSGWIYIVTSNYDQLPSPNHRVGKDDAVNMPKIVVKAGSGGAVNATNGAHHYRFVGIEFCPVKDNFVYNVVVIGGGEKTEAAQPNNITLDRCYIHGDPIAGSRRGVLMNGAALAVIDCYVADCKEDGADSQALAGYSGTGPLKIVNNFLEGAGENVIFGGADPSIPNAVLSDIEIRCNQFFKPLSWMQEEWDIKNLLEFKNAQRALVEGNRFENNWPNAQNGFSLLLTPRNQNGTAPWSVVQDITIRHNTFVNIAQGINMSGFDAPNVSQRTSRILIQNNVLTLAKIGQGSDGRLFQVLNGPTDVTFDHNTGMAIVAYVVSDGSPRTDQFALKNNLVSKGVYGFIGSGTGTVLTTLAAYFTDNWEITHNAVIGATPAGYPDGNFFPANSVAAGIKDSASRDYRLLPSSPYKNAGTDGKDIGADLDTIAKYSTYLGDDIGTGAVAARILSSTLMCYPNPANNVLLVEVDAIAKLSILDLLGREVIAEKSGRTIDVSMLPEGAYILMCSEGGETNSARFFVRH